MPFVFANIFQPLIDVADSVMVFFHNHVFHSWGMSIIALTIVVRAALIPLTLKQFKSMQTMQKLSPQIKELQAKYKGDKQRLNQEMMKFYQENKVNPLGSCLPLAAQMPIFLALFYMLRKDLKVDICPGIHSYIAEHGGSLANTACEKVAPGSAKFLFIPDLTHKATGSVLVVLIILYVGSQLASSLLMTVSADKNQRRMMLALPLVFVAFILSFPAGLIVYWITTNTWTILQQYIVKRTVGPMKPPELAMAGGGGGLGLKSLLGGGGADGAGNGKPAAGEQHGAKTQGAGKSGAGNGAPPPPSPRKKKKQRSGRRR